MFFPSLKTGQSSTQSTLTRKVSLPAAYQSAAIKPPSFSEFPRRT